MLPTLRIGGLVTPGVKKEVMLCFHARFRMAPRPELRGQLDEFFRGFEGDVKAELGKEVVASMRDCTRVGHISFLM